MAVNMPRSLEGCVPTRFLQEFTCTYFLNLSNQVTDLLFVIFKKYNISAISLALKSLCGGGEGDNEAIASYHNQVFYHSAEEGQQHIPRFILSLLYLF